MQLKKENPLRTHRVSVEVVLAPALLLLELAVGGEDPGPGPPRPPPHAQLVLRLRLAGVAARLAVRLQGGLLQRVVKVLL